MEFYGRKKELEALSKGLSVKEYPNVLIYGRRRVGKSAIITEHLTKTQHKSVYYQCVKSSDEANVESLGDLVKNIFGEKFLSFKDFTQIFDYLLEKAKNQRIILVLDEYTHWRDACSGFDSVVQRCLDKAKDGRLSLVVCGSEISILKDLDNESYPLHGRFSLKMKIDPFDYWESAMFLGDASSEDKAKYYCCFGGVPYLLSQIDPLKSFEENVKTAYLDSFAYVSSFVETTIKDEISKCEYGNAVLTAIANGARKYKDILSQSHIPNNVQMDRALKTLISLGVVLRECPINDQTNEKKSIYSLNDNAVAFYYRYVFKNQSFLKTMSIDSFYDFLIKKDLEEQFIPHRFEKMAKEYLIRANKNRLINPPLMNVGKYYYDDPVERKSGEFDVTTLSLDGSYRSYEVKWWKKPISEFDIEQEKEALKKIPLGEKVELGFFSKSGYVSPHSKDEYFFTLEDMYSF
ncbi:MAG: AAA family ATPase [Bacilli bacterium]|nr:AAA family ATPase [Bacilli bacterium]